jgi:hypothetical protein
MRLSTGVSPLMGLTLGMSEVSAWVCIDNNMTQSSRRLCQFTRRPEYEVNAD